MARGVEVLATRHGVAGCGRSVKGSTEQRRAEADGGDKQANEPGTNHIAFVDQEGGRVVRHRGSPSWSFVTPAQGGSQEIDDRRDQRRASFEIAASQLPQDEEFS